MRPNRLKIKKSSEFTALQYQLIANEYLSALQGTQTVITINLAVSIGVMAAMAQILSNVEKTQGYIIVAVLSIVGLVTDIASICTVRDTKEQVMLFQKQLNRFEKKYSRYIIHKIHHYKGLFITQAAFMFFAIIFAIVVLFSFNMIVNSIIENDIDNCKRLIGYNVGFFCFMIIFSLLLWIFLKWLYHREDKFLRQKIKNAKNDWVN